MIKITYFVHGTTIDNEKGIATGWLPGELSTLGIQQSKDLGNQVANNHFDVVFCSDLKRSIDSAKLAFGDKYKIIENEKLRECNYGDFNGTQENVFNGKTEYINKNFPKGESYKEVEKRIQEFLNFIKKNYEGKHIAIVSHQAPQLALDVLLKGKSWEDAFKEDWRNTRSWQPGWKYELN